MARLRANPATGNVGYHFDDTLDCCLNVPHFMQPSVVVPPQARLQSGSMPAARNVPDGSASKRNSASAPSEASEPVRVHVSPWSVDFQ